MLQAAIEKQVAEYEAHPGPPHGGTRGRASGRRQFAVLLHRMLLVNMRDIGVFWLRLALYVTLSFCVGSVHFRLGTTWTEGAYT